MLLARKDTLGAFGSAEGVVVADVDEEVFGDGDLIARPSTTALNLTGASIRDSSYPGEPGDQRGLTWQTDSAASL